MAKSPQETLKGSSANHSLFAPKDQLKEIYDHNVRARRQCEQRTKTALSTVESKDSRAFHIAQLE